MGEGLSRFKPIELTDQDYLNGIFRERREQLSFYNFANLFMWTRRHKFMWAEFEGRLVINADADGASVVVPTEGLEGSELITLAEILRESGRGADFWYVPTGTVEGNDEIARYFDTLLDEDNADYIYTSQNLAELSGRKLHNKKNLLQQFLRNNPDYECRPMEPGDFQACIDHSEKWVEDKSANIVAYAYETEAMLQGMEHFEELGLGGLVLVVKGALSGFSIFNRLNANTALIHFEKYDREIKGAGQAINRETARHLQQEYTFLNREQDLGIPGLRQAKQSYMPERWLLTYRLHWKK